MLVTGTRSSSPILPARDASNRAIALGLPRALVEAQANPGTVVRVLDLANPVASVEDRFGAARWLQTQHGPHPEIGEILIRLALTPKLADAARLSAGIALQGVKNSEVRSDLLQILDGNLREALISRLGLPTREAKLVIDPREATPYTVEDLLADQRIVDSITAVAIWALKLQCDDQVVDHLASRLEPSRFLDTHIEVKPIIGAAKILVDCPHPNVGSTFARCIESCLGSFSDSAPHLTILKSILDLFGPAQGGTRPASKDLYHALSLANVHGLLDDTLHAAAHAALRAREISSFDQFELKVTVADHGALSKVVQGSVRELSEVN